MDKVVSLILSTTISLTSFNFNSSSPTEITPPPPEVLGVSQPIQTESRFGSKLETKKTVIEKQTVYKDDPETEAGEETILDEGSDGEKIITTKVTYYVPAEGGKASFCEHEVQSSKPKCEAGAYEGEEYSREVVSTEIIEPKDKVISRGTKIVWRTLNTPDGEIRYWKKLRVYATHYDSRCLGCDEWTAIGMRAGKGVIAVDPKVIKMRSQVYVPGYGKAIAGDTGGAIKGNIIDLGFEDARTAGWSARYVNIYLLDKAPQ